MRWVARENGPTKSSLKERVEYFLVCSSRGKLLRLKDLQTKVIICHPLYNNTGEADAKE